MTLEGSKKIFMAGRNQKLGKPRNVRLNFKDCEAVDQLVIASGGEETDSDVLRKVVTVGLKMLAQSPTEMTEVARDSGDATRDSAALARIEKLLLEMRAIRHETRDEGTRIAALPCALHSPANELSGRQHLPQAPLAEARNDADSQKVDGDSESLPDELLTRNGAGIDKRKTAINVSDEDSKLSQQTASEFDLNLHSFFGEQGAQPPSENRALLASAREVAGEPVTEDETTVRKLRPGELPESMFDTDIDYEIGGDDDDEEEQSEVATKSPQLDDKNPLEL